MLKRLDHVELIPSDFERSLDFYTATLGGQLKHRYALEHPTLSEVAYISVGESAVELLHAPTARALAQDGERIGYRLMAFEVTDMVRTLTELAGKGITPSWGPVEAPAFIRAEITDPDGNAIELREWKQKP
ncbi:VOC family protein [Immundisolibacter sp.]|uniref:VOC family protein n=1 Tax=Immundisolibacter sp. TaxID=1934948 RepID=UPI0035662688